MQRDEVSDLTRKDLYEMSKAEQVDVHAKVWFKREPWYLTDKRIREEMMIDDLERVSGKECG